jgi:hypothetical protein
MPRRKEPKPDEWISSSEAAEILTERSGHPVSDAYVRLLARKGKVEVKPIGKRVKLFKREDVENYTVKEIKRDKDAA